MFVLPGRVLSAKHIAQDYNENLIARSHDEERFDTLIGDSQDQEKLPLENVDSGNQENQSPNISPAKKETRGRKRKSEELAGGNKMSEYQRKQEELQKQMEETLRKEKDASLETLRKERDVSLDNTAQLSNTSSIFPPPDHPEQSPGYGGATPGYQTPGYATPGYAPDTPGYPPAGHTPTCATPQFPDNNSAYNSYNNQTGQSLL